MTAIPRPRADSPAELLSRREEAGAHLVQPWPTAGKVGLGAPGAVGDGDGIYILHEDGRRLIDGPAGMWCVNLGHRRAELAQVMQDQAMALSYASPWYTSTTPALDLAARLAAHAPGDLDHVFLTTGGTSAVETALRFAFFRNDVKGRPEKKLIVTRDRAYHGASYLSGSLNGRPRDQDWMFAARDLVIRLSCPDPFRRPAGMTVDGFTDMLVDEFRQAIAHHGAERTVTLAGRAPKEVRKEAHGIAGEWKVPSLRWRILECSGHPDGQALAYALLSQGATMVQVGYTPATVTLRLSNVMAFDATVHGSWGCPPELYGDVLRLIYSGRVVLTPFVEHAPMSRVVEWLDAMAHHRLTRRLVLDPRT